MPPLQDEEQELEGLLGASSRQLGSSSQWAGASATARQVAASCTAAAHRLIQPASEEVLGLWLYVASTAFGTGGQTSVCRTCSAAAPDCIPVMSL